MALEPGTNLGPYQVTAKIGEGGMGEVYRARDTKLDRDVALKVLPEAFTSDPDRLARFEREAKVLASLNHTNIGGIHGLEESDGVRALVLEYIDGPTLADRIAQGPIPIDEALPIAQQIAEALEAAHEAGVIHRDLKPANVVIRDDGTVKVLDFGLAKAMQPDASDANQSMSPTISLTAAATQMGMVIGTAAYMAPEQAKGKVVDKRADVWAFGAVFYEMLAGKKPFTGKDVSDTLAAVLRIEADLDALPAETPLRLRQVLRACLQKEPKDRVRDIGDVSLAMEGTFDTTVSAPAEATATQSAGWRQALPWVAGIALAVISSLAVWSVMRAESPRVVRFTVAPDDAMPLAVVLGSPDVAISPNGDQLAYLTGSVGYGGEQLHVRPLAAWSSETLVAEGQLLMPFFSPDGQSVGFLDRSTTPPVLKRVAVRGGPTSTICDVPGRVWGASWGADDTIIFAASGGLSRVAAMGGKPEPLTTPDAEKGEVNHLWPEILPGGEAVLFTIRADPIEEAQIAVLSLDTLEYEVVLSGGTFPRYSPTGHLLYGVQGNLWAVGFDVNRLETVGDAVPVQEGVMTMPNGATVFGVSAHGSLVYVTGEVGGGEAPRPLVWVDRRGNEEPVAADPQPYASVQLSPDDQQVVTQVPSDGGTDLDVYDLARDTPRRFAFNLGFNNNPMWTPDGERILWSSGQYDFSIAWKAADGTGQVEPLTESSPQDFQRPYSWSADGQTLVMVEFDAETGNADIGLLSMDGERTIEWVVEGDSYEGFPDVSPDGRWMAYATDESGQFEVYVTQFPNVGERWKISQDGGLTPQWGPDSRELFFQTRGGTIMVATNETEPTFSPGTAAPAFGEPYFIRDSLFPPRAFDISSDGQRLLVIKEGSGSSPIQGSGAATDTTGEEPEIHVVLNWAEELTRLVPVD